jgi:trigger factor
MNITETSNDGLKRSFRIVISAQDIAAKQAARLEEVRQTVQLPGFRPGKVPLSVAQKRYGGSVLAEVLEGMLEDSSRAVVSERGLRPALQPKIDVEKYEEGGDLAFSMSLELLPDIEPGDLSGIELERPVAEVPEDKVLESLTRIAETSKTTQPITEDRPAENGDVVVIDFDGSVDGEKKPGMKGEGYELELGSGSFIPGYEEQLVGVKAGEHRSVVVTFPEQYHAAELAGKEAVFEVDVKEIRAQTVPAVDDDFAKKVGLSDLEELKKMVRERMEREYAGVSRLRVKRQLLDKLAEINTFVVPEGMVEIEFSGIWERLQQELKNGEAGEDASKSEDELKTEYRAIAERRVRLGLLLSEVGRRNNIEVTQDELNRAVINEARRFPGQERQVFEFFKNTPHAVENLKAPIFEDKVVDFIIELAKVTETNVSVEDLMRDPDDAEEKAA